MLHIKLYTCIDRWVGCPIMKKAIVYYEFRAFLQKSVEIIKDGIAHETDTDKKLLYNKMFLNHHRFRAGEISWGTIPCPYTHNKYVWDGVSED